MPREQNFNRYNTSYRQPDSSPQSASERLLKKVANREDTKSGVDKGYEAIAGYREKADAANTRQRKLFDEARAKIEDKEEADKTKAYQQQRYMGDDVMKGMSIGGSLGGPWGAMAGGFTGSVLGAGRSFAAGEQEGIDPGENIASILLGLLSPGLGATWDPKTGDAIMSKMPSDVGALAAGDYAGALGGGLDAWKASEREAKMAEDAFGNPEAAESGIVDTSGNFGVTDFSEDPSEQDMFGGGTLGGSFDVPDSIVGEMPGAEPMANFDNFENMDTATYSEASDANQGSMLQGPEGVLGTEDAADIGGTDRLASALGMSPEVQESVQDDFSNKRILDLLESTRPGRGTGMA